MMNSKDKKRPLFMISVVSKMLGVHPQTLRLYEREGLITPNRTKRSRLYSEEDVERLEMILRLTKELGVNKAGVEVILRMRYRLEAMQKEIEDMMDLLEDDVKRDFAERLRKVLMEE
ncbi:MAG: MerR family transcriptional regulator [Nitrospirae bacterium RBG_13_43_8]|nr:MAG: MerR family transcriptional regulator [Nitrospirae bacterium RBG_13_43_8]